jgi:PKD repeat protein
MGIKPKCKITVVSPVLLLVISLVCCGSRGYAKLKDTTVQVSGNAFVGQHGAKILSYKVTLPSFSPKIIFKPTKFYFSTKGSTNVKDIISARLYFTGSNDYASLPLNPSDTAGKAIQSPNGSFVFYTSKPLQFGTNYFILTYDVSTGAQDGNLLDATLDSAMIQDTLRAVNSGNPNGAKLLDLYGSYCNITVAKPNKTSPQYIGITSVKIGKSFNNSSADLDKLTMYVTPKIQVYRQETYPVEIKYGQGHNEQIIGWVDWNNDGYFDPATEEVFYTGSSLSAETYKTSIQVPCTATVGAHKLRIMSDIDTIAKLRPCGNLRYGDAEEYIIDVKPDIVAIKTSFTKPDTAFNSSITYFKNSSNARGHVTYDWAFNKFGAYTETGETSNMTYQTVNFGYKKIWMRLTWYGCDTTIVHVVADSIYVASVKRAPAASFIVSSNIADTSTIIQFTDLSTGSPGAWYWQITPSIINGAPAFTFLNGSNFSSQNPVLKFNRNGIYDVSLRASNLAGGSTSAKKGCITIIDNVRMCDGHDTIKEPSGFLYDDGGKDHPYQNNKSCFLVIKPPCAASININFTSFDVSALGKGNDGLKIYDSTNFLGKPLHSGYTTGFRNALPGNVPFQPGTITAKSGSAYIEWNTDSTFTGDGFAATWTSVLKTSTPPKAAFLAPSTVFVHHNVTFKNNSTGPGLQYFWDLNGDGINDNNQANPVFRYDSAGTFTIRLIARNCGGVDTLYKKIIVTKPASRPKADFSSNYYYISDGDQVQLTDLSTQAPYKWRWHIVPEAHGGRFTFINSDTFSQNPIVRFEEPDSFLVQLFASNDFGTDSIVKTIHVQVYCKPTAFTSHIVGISNVLLTNRVHDTLISQTSTNRGQYTYFGSLNPPSVVADEKYNITVSRDTTGTPMTGKVWIDYNGNGIFEPFEEVLRVPNITGRTWNGSFTMSRGSKIGLSRLRVGVVYDKDSLFPCGANRVGAFQDYNIVQQKDTIPPKITLKGRDTVIVELQRNYIDAGAILFDNEDGDITTYNLKTVSTVNNARPGIYAVTFSGQDNAKNNAKTTIRTVIVIGDTTKPQIVLYGNQTEFIEVYNSYVEDSAFVNDNIDTSLTYTISGSVDTAHLGTYFVTYTSTDDAGNTAVNRRRVIVGDTIKPWARLLGKKIDSLQVNTHYVDPGVQDTDNYNKRLILKIAKKLDSSKIGTQIIAYVVFDSSGNRSDTVKRIVRVNNYERPSIRFPFDTLLWDVNRPFVHPFDQAIVHDNYYKLTVKDVYNLDNFHGNHADFVHPNKIGFYPVFYYTRTPSGISSLVDSVIVHVVDRVAPSIIITGDTVVHLNRWEKYSDDQYYGISDNYDPNPQLIEEPHDFKNAAYPYIYFDRPGTFFINYILKDASGNTSKPFVRWFMVTDRAGVENTSMADAGLQYFPNPANDKLVLNYHAAQPQNITINISDMLGRPVETLFSGTTAAIEFTNDISTLPAGVYSINLITAERSFTYKLVISR